MVEQARDEDAARARRSRRFQVGDASALPFDEGSFDLVTLMNAIPFFDELARARRPARGSSRVLAQRETPITCPTRACGASSSVAASRSLRSFAAEPATAFLAFAAAAPNPGQEGVRGTVAPARTSFFRAGLLSCVEVRSLATAPESHDEGRLDVRAVFEFGEIACNQSLVEASLPPGGSTERHLHATSEELYVILDGAGEMEIEGDRAPVAAGDVVLIPPGSRHQITAIDGPLRFLCCCSPPYRHEDTILDS